MLRNRSDYAPNGRRRSIIGISARDPAVQLERAIDDDRTTGSVASSRATETSSASTIAGNTAPDRRELRGATTANEGEQKTYSVSATDPDAGDTLTYAWSVMGGNATIAGSSTGSSVNVNFTDGPSTVTLQVVVTDGNSPPVTRTLTITEANVAPTVVLSGLSPADEGQTKTYTYTVSDPGNDPNPTITESCGANATYVNTVAANSFDCTFPDGPASTTVSVSANDGDPTNNTGSDSKVVAIANVAPTVVLTGADYGERGSTKTYTYTVSDPGNDPNPAITESCGRERDLRRTRRRRTASTARSRTARRPRRSA